MKKYIEFALCRVEGKPSWFFSPYASETNAAMAICRRCPVRLACFAEALASGAEFGVWGGVLLGSPAEETPVAAISRGATGAD